MGVGRRWRSRDCISVEFTTSEVSSAWSKTKKLVLGASATAFRTLAARAWGLFGWRFGISGGRRKSLEWEKWRWDDDFSLGFKQTRAYCSLAQTRSLASLEWFVWQLKKLGMGWVRVRVRRLGLAGQALAVKDSEGQGAGDSSMGWK